MNLNNVLAKAQKMMLDENWNRQVEIGAAAQRAGSINGGGNKYDPSLAAMEEMAFGSSSMRPDTGYNRNPIPQNVRIRQSSYNDGTPVQIIQEQHAPRSTNSKLPKEILESFEQMPSPIDDSYGMTPGSVLDTLNLPQINEQQYQMQQPQPRQGGIDYAYIKYLIDESIKSHMGGMLNENASLTNFKGMRLAQGGVIQFIDTKGNLFEGKLVLKKKAK